MNALDAAYRIKAELEAAKISGYLTSGWYFYLDRLDVQAVVEEVLNPTEESRRYAALVRHGSRQRVVKGFDDGC